MKTEYMKQYEERVVHYISNLDIAPQTRAIFYLDFLNNSEEYFDELCTLIYGFSSNILPRQGKYIWLTPSGAPYISSVKRKSFDQNLVGVADIAPFDGDIRQTLSKSLSNF